MSQSRLPLRVLTFSTLYPNAANPGHGPFVEQRLRKLVFWRVRAFRCGPGDRNAAWLVLGAPSLFGCSESRDVADALFSGFECATDLVEMAAEWLEV